MLEDYHGYEFPIEEERMAHAVVEGLDDQDQIAARQVLQDYPWVEVRASTYRYYHRSHALPHILGQLGAVTEATLAGDPNKGNELTRYRSTEKLGVSGVEYAAEGELRGRRGLFQQNRAGQVVENISAVNGADVTLTLRLDLQEALYELMAEMLPNTPYPSGGAIVVLDVPTREVLALVSYPGYDSRDYRKHYNELAGDMRRQPLRFRAIANAYAPGSIMKPLTCIAGLSLGKITLTTTFDCQGYYYPKTRSGRKCWRIHGTNRRKAHGPLMVSDAIAHSCNIFMYHTGERVGVRGLCDYFDMAGVGRSSGVGLPEAARGINPTESYINSRGRSVTKGDAWNYAIGQGEVNMTPLQTANLMAVYAGGIYKPVTLIRTGSEPAQWRLPVKAQHWRAIRSGLFRVTNERGATAYKTAHFVRDGYALCGKTGSATVWPAVVSYTIPYTTAAGEEAVAIVPGNSKREAGERFEAHYGEMDFEWGLVVPHDYWPPLQGSHKRPAKGDEKEHAWFIAYLQAVDRSGAPMLDVTPRIAFSVLVEFGGSGGRAAGPIAARVADILLDTLGPGLDPDAVRDDTRP
ncbi:MAG: hypothetical protein KAV82_00155 [Phycisphaerae bacterium]|nr:hypothetical protein [Phycisphaerae bacterium]